MSLSLIHDSPFTGADGTAIPALTPTLGTALFQGAGSDIVASNRAAAVGAAGSSALLYCVDNLNSLDRQVVATISSILAIGCYILFTIRDDGSNFYYLLINDGGAWRVGYNIGAGLVDITSGSLALPTGSNVVDFSSVGTNIVFIYNGSTLWSASDTHWAGTPANSYSGVTHASTGIVAPSALNGIQMDRLQVYGNVAPPAGVPFRPYYTPR